MFEYVGNLHAHTTTSDGAGSHGLVAAAAIRAGLDFVVITDHNVWVSGVEGYYQNRHRERVLLLTGEEVHDMTREPQRNHLLVFGAGREMAAAGQGQRAQALLDAVRQAGGVAFLAHPIDRAVPWAGEGSYSWDDWDVAGYTGLELWNYMSTVKAMLPHMISGILRLLAPATAVIGPDPDILALWDALLQEGRRVVAIGSADAHAAPMQMGPLRRVIYPYQFLFRCVNTHVLVEHPLSGSWEADAAALYSALAQGHAFVGYSLPGSPRGFRFEALNGDRTAAIMGDQVSLADCEALLATAPAAARLRLLHNGRAVAEQDGRTLTYTPARPGAYRVEAWKPYRGRRRGWIFSNPIYVTLA